MNQKFLRLLSSLPLSKKHGLLHVAVGDQELILSTGPNKIAVLKKLARFPHKYLDKKRANERAQEEGTERPSTGRNPHFTQAPEEPSLRLVRNDNKPIREES
jgi:flagellar biogenesis protein FliO